MSQPTAMTEQDKEQRRARLRVYLRAQVARVSDEQVTNDPSRPHELAQRMTGSSSKLETSQIRNVENLAYTTDKVSDITDLIKKSVGRDSRSRGWAKDQLGQDTIAALEALRADANRIVGDVPPELKVVADDDLPRRVHLELCREFVKHLTAEFLYRKPEASHERS